MDALRNASFQASPLMPFSGIPLLDSFPSGFSLISSYLPLVFLLTTATASLQFCIPGAVEFLNSFFMSQVEIRMDDEMFDYLMYWISQQSFSRKATRFVAGTKTRSHLVWYDDSDDDDDDEMEKDMPDNFDDYWARRITLDKIKPIRITPAEGQYWFWYKHRLISFARTPDDSKQIITWGTPTERLYLRCLGRDASILKELLREAQQTYVDRDGNKTIIYRGQKSAAGADHDWVRCMARPPRPLSTVVLDDAQKQAFLEDVKEYLHPRTRRWYSNRGIPYRRGYMFYGPPGTGKSSLCFAAAGALHLKIYLVSLNSKSLTEDSLAAMFQSLPRRCIVLLEDVDAAGMTNKRGDSTSDAPPQGPGHAAAIGEETDKDDDKTAQGVSLSALLNIIDGVASSEGRILVMTTNHIEKLDPALLRPGRVDMTIEFGYSDRVSIRDLFLAIYAPLEGDLPDAKIGNGAVNSAYQATSKAELVSLAEEFASRIPSGEFTPAEIQGYLLQHKQEPELAIKGAEAWVQDIREEKARKRAQTASK
ncbi:hypothetical protein VTN96DRAFT_4038 [Rasamsonia emersonii]|uniref:BCS1-like ATPase n=1 Tax=Rasamsonia emersonii (strain ATCC 16479 / CBS 393.64 / IMI 116815) TaxID=1408163 RepID=A0A0F4YQP4_RASE3|nr:BCS1-like ATPase [Rasamsonia emersonii CBS 393.64]KKA20141.1 BCS1-like ATPase [Rasamsonia emersonii CBS 393.64]